MIENKTFVADDVQIVFGDYTMTNVVYYNTLGEEHLIVFSLIGKDGNNTFEIQLSDAVTDTLVLNLESGPQICGWSFLALNSATYNGELQTLEDFSGQNHLIIIVK